MSDKIYELFFTEAIYKTSGSIYGDNQSAQTFTVGSVGDNETIYLSRIRLRMKKTLSPTATITVEVKAVDVNHKPTGGVLSTGTFESEDVELTGGWVYVSMSAASLTTSTEYIIIARAGSGNDSTNRIAWTYQDDDNYAGGVPWQSDDAGVSWSSPHGGDKNFFVRGETVPTVIADNPTRSSTTATLIGEISNDGGTAESCTCSYEWGLTDSYGNTEAGGVKTEGEDWNEANLTGLSPGTTYHYRAKAVNSRGNGYSVDATFTTSGAAYPSSGFGRVGSLIHRRDIESNAYSLEISFGGLAATPPSTASARLSGTLGTETPQADIIPTCPPDWNLRYSAERGWYCAPPATPIQRGDMDVSKEAMGRLTPYAQDKIQWLYQHGYVSATGVPTAKGTAWAEAHPTEDPYEHESRLGKV